MKTASAMAGSMIKKELKNIFPKTKFSVKSDNFANGSSVDVSWTDGPTTEQVNLIIKKYQYGHFDGMIDMYEYSNNREDIPQAKWVGTSRDLSNEMRLQASKVAKNHYADLENVQAPETVEDLGKSFTAFNRYYNWYDLAYMILSKIDLTDAKGIEEDPNFTGGSICEGFLATT